METVTSISGGKTSAYIAANYESDYLVFALVRIEDKKFKDNKIRRLVEDKIKKPFVGTAEDDTIIYTMLDLEQYLGKKIHWVTGPTFEQAIQSKGGYLPNKTARYCTTLMKMEPIFYWWAETIGQPVKMQIGYRANETQRAKRMLEKLNEDGLSEYKATFEQMPNGRNKWENIAWRQPVFPLIENGVRKDTIEKYWQDKPVRFAKMNNCVGCFHRNPLLLKKMWDYDPQKMQWFDDQEQKTGNQFRSDVSYSKIKQHKLQAEIGFSDFSECDSGFCGI